MLIFISDYFELHPSKHTTSFWRLYNVHNVKTTSYGRQNNVVCLLGQYEREFLWNITRYQRFSIKYVIILVCLRIKIVDYMVWIFKSRQSDLVAVCVEFGSMRYHIEWCWIKQTYTNFFIYFFVFFCFFVLRRIILIYLAPGNHGR